MIRPLRQGFTLIEVLLALAIISIALTAVLKASSQNVINTQHLKDRSIAHLIAMQAAQSIQLGLYEVPSARGTTKSQTMFGKRWYWHAKTLAKKTPFAEMIEIRVGQKPSGPFMYPVYVMKPK